LDGQVKLGFGKFLTKTKTKIGLLYLIFLRDKQKMCGKEELENKFEIKYDYIIS
jgi:hypothetical protein